jgi:hypothetical protein
MNDSKQKLVLLGFVAMLGFGPMASADGLKTKPAASSAMVGIYTWQVLDGAEKFVPIPSAYLGILPSEPKTSAVATGAAIAGAAAGAILPTGLSKATMDGIVEGPASTVSLSGPFVGFLMYFNDSNAKWGKAYRLVRLQDHRLGRNFAFGGYFSPDVLSEFDVTKSIKMGITGNGTFEYLKLVPSSVNSLCI